MREDDDSRYEYDPEKPELSGFDTIIRNFVYIAVGGPIFLLAFPLLDYAFSSDPSPKAEFAEYAGATCLIFGAAALSACKRNGSSARGRVRELVTNVAAGVCGTMLLLAVALCYC
jgi:hypothetical protein